MQKYEPAWSRTDIVVVTERWNQRFDELHCARSVPAGITSTGQCLVLSDYVSITEREAEIFGSYKFADSMDALNFAFQHTAQMELYDWVVRTDLDTFFTPAFAEWHPNRIVVGGGAFCFSGHKTCKRLRRIAVDMKLVTIRHKMIENVGSTWYGPLDDIAQASKLTVQVMRYLHVHEFTEEEKSPEYGTKGWPEWHHGVLLLYAGQIAMNAVKGNEFDKMETMLDFPTTSNDSVWEHAHLHTWQDDERFSKFAFFDGDYDDVRTDSLNPEIIRDYAMKMALESRHPDST